MDDAYNGNDQAALERKWAWQMKLWRRCAALFGLGLALSIVTGMWACQP